MKDIKGKKKRELREPISSNVKAQSNLWGKKGKDAAPCSVINANP